MKKILLVITLFLTLHASSQSVFGYWYGYANVEGVPSANNYLIELIVQQKKGTANVEGILNYYFKNTFRSLKVKGKYNKTTRLLVLEKIPVTFHGSPANLEVDCIMNFQATLRVSKVNSILSGSFVGTPEYKYTCVNINFNLSLDADASKEDSVLSAMRQYKETYQLWKPSGFDTLEAEVVVTHKVVNYVKDTEYKERENVVAGSIEVESDSLQVDFYDNGEVDGDSISVFFNGDLIAANRKLSIRALHFDFVIDSTREINEITMFADNLGTIPPNTALMIVNDGKKRYEVRLSSDLEKNATLRIRRKKPR